MIYTKKNISKKTLNDFIIEINHLFAPPLSKRFKISAYVNKIYNSAEILFYKPDNEIGGLIAFYCNDNESRISYITLIVVLPQFQGKGIGLKLIDYAVSISLKRNMKKLRLEVNKNNPAFNFYSNNNFNVVHETDESFIMEKSIGS